MVDDAMKQQRPILHQPEHGNSSQTSAFFGPTTPHRPVPRYRKTQSRRNTVIMPDIAAMRLALAILGLTGALVGTAAAETIPLPRPRPPMPPVWAEPHSFREAAGPDFNSDGVTSEPSECRDRK